MALVDAVGAVASGQGRVVLVRAAAGLGKTRLLDVAAGLAAGAGLELLRAGGNSLERDFPFGVVLGLFEARLRAAEDRERLLDGSAGLAGPMLLGVQPVEQALLGLPEHSLIHALRWLVVNLGTERPVALVVDDLHWADAPSLRFLAYLAARVTELPVLVVGALRPREPGAENDLLAQLSGSANAQVLVPRALSDAATAEIVTATSGMDRDAHDEFVRACFEATGGNPLLLSELLRALAAEGARGGVADVARVREIGPEAIIHSVRSTLARLGADESALAVAVAVLGDDADPAVAAGLAGLSAPRAAAAGALLQDAGLLGTGAPLCFTHPLLRRAVYEDLAPAARGEAHRRAAVLLRPTHDETAVAAHLLLAPGAGEGWAVQALLDAARTAGERAAHGTAARLLRRAMSEPPDETLLPVVVAEAALAAGLAGEEGAVAELDAALTVVADAATRRTLLLALARAHYQRGDMAASLAACDRAIAEGGGEPAADAELEAAWVAAALWTPVRTTDIDERLARALADPLPGTLGERELLAGLAGIELLRGTDRERTLVLARRAWGDGAYLEDGGTSDAPALGGIGSALLRSGALEEVLAVHEALIADARRRASPLAYAQWRSARGLCLLHLGRIGEAESDLEEAIEARAIGWEASLPMAIEGLVSVLLAQGRIDRAEEILESVQRGAGGGRGQRHVGRRAHGARKGGHGARRSCGRPRGVRGHRPHRAAPPGHVEPRGLALALGGGAGAAAAGPVRGGGCAGGRRGRRRPALRGAPRAGDRSAFPGARDRRGGGRDARAGGGRDREGRRCRARSRSRAGRRGRAAARGRQAHAGPGAAARGAGRRGRSAARPRSPTGPARSSWRPAGARGARAPAVSMPSPPVSGGWRPWRPRAGPTARSPTRCS